MTGTPRRLPYPVRNLSLLQVGVRDPAGRAVDVDPAVAVAEYEIVVDHRGALGDDLDDLRAGARLGAQVHRRGGDERDRSAPATLGRLRDVHVEDPAGGAVH